jgi:hypothetical protein
MLLNPKFLKRTLKHTFSKELLNVTEKSKIKILAEIKQRDQNERRG